MVKVVNNENRFDYGGSMVKGRGWFSRRGFKTVPKSPDGFKFAESLVPCPLHYTQLFFTIQHNNKEQCTLFLYSLVETFLISELKHVRIQPVGETLEILLRVLLKQENKTGWFNMNS